MGAPSVILEPSLIARLQGAALEAGFDRPLSPVADWLVYDSSQAQLRVWLTADPSADLLVAVSRHDVDRALEGLGTPSEASPPAGAVAVRAAASLDVLLALLRQAHHLARTLPRQLLQAYQLATAGMPRTTPAEQAALRQAGQAIFRDGLLDYWEGRCAVTGLDVPELLQASHVKPWDACAGDAERFDLYNGLVLALHLHAAFASGLVGVTEAGALIASPRLAEASRRALGWDPDWAIPAIKPGHVPYLRWHLNSVFKR